MVLFRHFGDSRAVHQLVVIFHVVLSRVLVEGMAKGAATPLKLPGSVRRLKVVKGARYFVLGEKKAKIPERYQGVKCAIYFQVQADILED